MRPVAKYLLGGGDPERFRVVPPVGVVLIFIISDEEIFIVFDVVHVVVNHPVCSSVQSWTDDSLIKTVANAYSGQYTHTIWTTISVIQEAFGNVGPIRHSEPPHAALPFTRCR